MPDACDRRCCCSSHAATARITHTRNACPVSSYVAGKRLEQTLAGHPRIAPSPFAPVGPPHLPLTAVVWCLYLHDRGCLRSAALGTGVLDRSCRSGAARTTSWCRGVSIGSSSALWIRKTADASPSRRSAGSV